jgi:hypothetical protein
MAVLVHVTSLLITSAGGAIAFVLGQRARARRHSTEAGPAADHLEGAPAPE